MFCVLLVLHPAPEVLPFENKIVADGWKFTATAVFQPFNRSYSQWTFVNFHGTAAVCSSYFENNISTHLCIPGTTYSSVRSTIVLFSSINMYQRRVLYERCTFPLGSVRFGAVNRTHRRIFQGFLRVMTRPAAYTSAIYHCCVLNY